jgi:hypothetical protein
MPRFVLINKRLGCLPYLLIPVILATWLYAPALFDGKTQIHGDSIFHSISALELNRRMIHEGVSPLWSNLVYGGHPYFAESQGGFLNPLNLAVALFFEPVTGQNVYHWLSMIIGALGMFSLCRRFHYSRDASAYGALAVVFSGYWLHAHHNITISGALCWIPWVFLSLERWLENPVGRSAVWLALAVSVLFFSGYPQAFHGAIIYMTVSLIPTLFSGYTGNQTGNSLKQYVITGTVAIAVCAGVTAVQWLPLMELTTWSHRSGGIDSLYQGSLSFYIPEFLFTFNGRDVNTLHLGIVGSVCVCFVATLSLALKPGHRMIGHGLASIFLIILGLENATPLFGQLLKYSLIPGLQYFRIFHFYLGVSIIGLGLLGAFAIDRIQGQAAGPARLMKDKLIFFIAGSVLFFTWTGLVWLYQSDHVSRITYGLFISTYVILMCFIFTDKPSWFGRAALMLIVVEIMALRMSPFPFFDVKTFPEPRIARYIQGNSPYSHYKLMNMSSAGLSVFIHPWHPGLKTAIHDAVMRGCANANILWNIPSIDANLALQLAQRRLIQPQLEDELSGGNAAPPGARLIDYLGIRFISTDAILPAPGLKALTSNGIVIMENKHALPHVQIFTRYEMANSTGDALNRLKKSNKATLFLESPAHQAPDVKSLPVSAAVNDHHAVEILSSKMSNVQYEFAVNAGQPAWLFIADANYPGWQAYLDGQPAPVYSAQVLGKAVPVPSGRHQITVEYKPKSFVIGLFLTVCTLPFLFIAAIRT